jgi:hypothetical protein
MYSVVNLAAILDVFAVLWALACCLSVVTMLTMICVPSVDARRRPPAELSLTMVMVTKLSGTPLAFAAAVRAMAPEIAVVLGKVNVYSTSYSTLALIFAEGPSTEAFMAEMKSLASGKSWMLVTFARARLNVEMGPVAAEVGEVKGCGVSSEGANVDALEGSIKGVAFPLRVSFGRAAAPVVAFLLTFTSPLGVTLSVEACSRREALSLAGGLPLKPHIKPTMPAATSTTSPMSRSSLILDASPHF